MTAAVELLRISKGFPGVRALEDVDLALRFGSIHALVGENGAGKSTLINILSGVLPADSGEIRIDGQSIRFSGPRSAHRHGIVTVHQEVDLFPDLSVADNLGLEQGMPHNRCGWIDRRALRRQITAALKAIDEDLPLAAPARVLSPAQRQLVLIAAAVSQSARVLILDEPTSSLSDAEAQVLFRQLRRFREQGAAILYVSHRLEEIFALADEVTVLRDGRRVWTGPAAVTTPAQLIGRMVGRELTTTARDMRTPGDVRFACAGLTATDGSFAGISFDIRGGEVLGLYGLIGAGRSEWAQTVFGLRPKAGGEIRIDGKPIRAGGPAAMLHHGLVYVPEDRLRQGLCRGLTVRANIVLAMLRRLGCRIWLMRSHEAPPARRAIDQFGVRAHSTEQIAGTLSGGNQQKVVLARWLGVEPKVLLLDEPTRGIDVGAKAEVHALIQRLASEGKAIALISSDLPEVLAQSDRVAVVREGRLAGIFDSRTTSAAEVAAAAYPAADNVAGTGAGATATHASGRLLRPRLLPPRLFHLLRECALAALLIAVFGFLEFRTGRFLQAANLQNLATDAALLAFCAVGTSLVILAGGLDISLGALMALSAGIAGRLWERQWPLPAVMATAIAVGGLGGFLNAALSLVGRVHPIVVTLGTMSIYRGLTLWWLGQDVSIPGEARNWLFAGALGLPVILWAGAGLALFSWVALQRTVAGRELYALGSNPAAAHRIGIGRPRIWLSAFTLQGVCVGLAGLLYLARSGNLQPSSYENETLRAIAAAVVGGVAITGGRGSVWGTALGCLFLVALPQATTFLGISPNWDRTLAGGVMVAAVLLDALCRRQDA